MPPTERLYYDDPALLSFDAVVAVCQAVGEGYRVSLDRSAFYPSSGGQPHDTGALHVGERMVAVADVIAEEGTVWHRVPAPLEPGTHVRGEIDRLRRQDFRQQHSGQHILSASFDHVLDARTESVHLGLDASTLDLHREVTAEQCRQAEEHANQVVWDDRPVSIRYADADALANEPRLRRQTMRAGIVRLIDIAAHDLSACGGTHVGRTGEVGAIVIRAVERFRGGTRVTFLCGRRALESYRGLRDALDAAARTLSAAPSDVPHAVDRLRDDLRQAQRRAEHLAERLTALDAAALASRVPASGVIVAHLPDADAQTLRATASQLIAAPGRVVALLGGGSPHALLVARSADRTDVDAGALVRQLCALHGGKGGGRADLAQAGGVAVSVDAVRAALEP